MKGLKRNMIVSDLHVPYIDNKAFNAFVSYTKDYKPHELVIAGDLIDFYSLSMFDKNPDRKEDVQMEIIEANKYLDRIAKVIPKGCKVTYLEGNHETRLQKFLWKNKELHSLKCLRLDQMLELKKRGINFVGASHDYWKNDNGHYKIADMLIMHGDNRLNGASCSKYSGYSANNTMRTMYTSVAHGHGHRLALINQTTPEKQLVGMETGCLCDMTGTANWQQGFATFETYRGKSINHRIHKINNGVLMEDGKKYIGR